MMKRWKKKQEFLWQPFAKCYSSLVYEFLLGFFFSYFCRNLFAVSHRNLSLTSLGVHSSSLNSSKFFPVCRFFFLDLRRVSPKICSQSFVRDFWELFLRFLPELNPEFLQGIFTCGFASKVYTEFLQEFLLVVFLVGFSTVQRSIC